MRSIAIILLAYCAACAATAPLEAPATTEEFTAGLQYSGAVGQVMQGTRVEISAPILPDSSVWQYKGGAGYPKSQGEAVSLIADTTYTFEFLVSECQAKYPTIVIATAGNTPTLDQLRTNYDQVSRCAYEQHGAKPYWMPQILDDVDVCAQKLGAGWRLLAEADLALFSEADYQFFKDTMTLAQGSDWFPREFYFSLDVYVRGRDGKLKAGDLTPGAQHVVPLPMDESHMKDLYVGNGRPIGVRCVRTGK